MKVADLNDDFFKQMGYAFGQDTKAPWKSAETTPVLYFENTALVLTLSDNAVLLDNDADCYITATVYGQSADDITAVSDNSNVADVDIESREDGVATLHITSYKDGVANINVTVGTLTMACTVTVDHTLTTVKPLDQGTEADHPRGWQHDLRSGCHRHHGLHARRTGGCSVRLHHQRTRQGPLHREGNGRYGSSDNGKGNGEIIAYEE